MVTGSLIFEGLSDYETLLEHVNRPPVLPSQRTETAIPAELEQIIMACLEKDPHKRPQSATELIARLKAVPLRAMDSGTCGTLVAGTPTNIDGPISRNCQDWLERRRNEKRADGFHDACGGVRCRGADRQSGGRKGNPRRILSVAVFSDRFASMVIVSSLLSVAAGFVIPRLLSTRSSSRLLSWGFVGSSGLLLLEWGISTRNPATAAVLIYLQMTDSGSVLISGSGLFDDRFDALLGARQFGKIVVASTIGGIVGGVLPAVSESSTGSQACCRSWHFLHSSALSWHEHGYSSGKPVQRHQRCGQKRPASSGLMILRSAPMSAIWHCHSVFNDGRRPAGLRLQSASCRSISGRRRTGEFFALFLHRHRCGDVSRSIDPEPSRRRKVRQLPEP